MTPEYITEGGYRISNPAGLQEETRKISVQEGHHLGRLNDRFGLFAVI